MSIQPQDLLQLATQLATGSTETELRSSISRAYYASYHASKAWASSLPLQGSNTGPQGGMHQEFCNRLKHPATQSVGAAAAQKSKLIGMMLDVMRTQRKIADYELNSSSQDKAAAAGVCSNAASLMLKASVYP